MEQYEIISQLGDFFAGFGDIFGGLGDLFSGIFDVIGVITKWTAAAA
ncbi:PorACj family cell wall channel-forming small protein [Corynebacterium suicordis]|nr:PorACj family cell wall channel-forming small protein [uncultured Corynebacterium sp.]